MLSITYQAHSVEQKLLQVFVNDAHEVRLKVLKENELVMEDYTMLSKPETISQEIIKASAELEGQSLAERFKKKTLELAREGYFGSLRTHHSQLQNSYANLIHLLDQSHIPILIFGETGAGKRRLVDEYFVLHNFYRRLDNLKQGQLRVYKSDFLSSGWTEFLTPKHNTSADLIYLENIEDLHKDRQRELLQFLKDRKKKAQTLQEVPRIVLGTEKALSLLVMQDKFIRELFYEITTFSIFLPSLQERSEDILCLIQSISLEMSGRTQAPPTWFVDFVSNQIWSRNFDELRMLMKNLFLKKKDMLLWEVEDLPALYSCASSSAPFEINKLDDVTMEIKEKRQIEKALARFHGDRVKAAQLLGYSRSEFLQKLLFFKIR